MCKIFLFLLSVILAAESMAQNIHRSQKIKFLALGDSYTIGESVKEHQRWPVQLAQALRDSGIECNDPTIIATTGWRTDQLKDAIREAALPHNYNLVSLLIGVNNQYQGKPTEGYRAEFEDLLKIAIQYAGNDHTKVFVVSIPDYGYTPFGKSKKDQISREIDIFNEINRSLAEQYHIKYFNITPISRRGLAEENLIAEDGLHPSGEMYSAWVKLILEGIKIR